MKNRKKCKKGFSDDAEEHVAKRFKGNSPIDNEETTTNSVYSNDAASAHYAPAIYQESNDNETIPYSESNTAYIMQTDINNDFDMNNIDLTDQTNANMKGFLLETKNDDILPTDSSDNEQGQTSESEASDESDSKKQEEDVHIIEPNDIIEATDCSGDSDSQGSVSTVGSTQPKSSNKTVQIEKKDSDSEQNSYSSISFEKSDEDFDNFPILPLNVRALKQRSNTPSPEPSIPSPKASKQQQQVPSSAASSNTNKTNNNATYRSKLPQHLFCQGPLSFIAEAMGAGESSNKRDTTDSRSLPANSFNFFNSQSTDARNKSESARPADWVSSQTVDNNDSSSSSSPAETANNNNNRCETKQKFEDTMISYLNKMSGVPIEKEGKSKVLPAAAVSLDKVPKDLDSDDSVKRRKAKSVKPHKNNNRDFYEDDSSLEDDKLNSEDDDDDKFGSDYSYSEFVEYESLFDEIRKMIEKIPKRFKYEISRLVYPVLAIFYLRMVASGQFRKGKEFVESHLRCIDQSYMPRVDKLLALQTMGDVPKKAKKYISDNNEQVAVPMTEETYQLLLIFMQSWSRSLQTLFLRHFDLVPEHNCGIPRQYLRIGSGPLEKVFWATSEVLNEKLDKSALPRRRKRLKKQRTSPTRNVNLPLGNRLYTPFLKRWDLERIKDDEERRVPLSRDNLPSAYLYTAFETVDTVICATFSSKSTMLSIGTAAATINVFSLTTSKLVHLKSAKFLKMLDTSVSGIDDNMLDESKRKMRRILYGHQGPVYGCTFAPNDRFLLSCSQDRTVRCWCLLSWSCVVIYPGHCAAIYSVIYAPFGYYFATCSDDCTARIWTQDNKKSICIFVGHLAEVVCCLFHPNRHYLATGSADCTVRLWDIIKAVQVRLFSAHKDSVNALAFSMCGRFLVSGADDHYVIVWDTDKEEMVRCLPYHTGYINCIEFALDNKIFVVGGQDCQMTLWDFERLICEYDPDKEKKTDCSCTGLAGKQAEDNIDDVLITAYASKNTPFYKLGFTNRNLLIGFCVKPKDALKDENKAVDAKAKYDEWLEFLDILILKACYKQNEET